MLRHIVLIFIIACMTTGCATVNRGIDDHFRIDTVPQGAKITTSIETPKSIRNRKKDKSLSPEYYGCDPTPCAIQLSRLSEFTFIVEHDGYEPVEMYVTNSNRKGSMTANTAASVASTAGTVAAGAAVTAPTIAALAGTAGAITYGTLSVSTFGLIVPVETAVSAGFAAGASAAPSTASLMSTAVPPALAVTGGMLLFDAGVGANRSLYPNPVVLGLTPTGLPVKHDPAVKLFKIQKSAQDTYDAKCKIKNSRNGLYKRSAECRALKVDLRQKKNALKVLLSPSKEMKKTPSSAHTPESK